MEPLDASAVARLLVEIGQRFELAGDSPFKSRAYFRAAESLLALTTPLDQIIAQERLLSLSGVGEVMAEKISTLHATGTHPTLERLRQKMPASVLELLRVPGLGPKKVALIYETLGISTLADLMEACKTGRITQCKGLGGRMQEKIQRGISFLQKGTGFWLLEQAHQRLAAACLQLQTLHPAWQRLVPAGPTRRGCELVDELSIVAQSDEPVSAGRWQTVSFQGDIRIHLAPPDAYGLALLFATGAPAHLEALRAFAAAAGFKLDPFGLRRGNQEIACADERGIYEALHLPYIEPELREGRGEVELAAKQGPPVLVQEKDLRGILHAHTTYSDGVESLARLAEEVRRRGYQYLGVAEHSKSAAYAGGLSEERLLAQCEAVREWNSRHASATFRIFMGIESDIREKGELDYPDALLKKLDFVIASVHNRFELDKQAQTQRIIKAVSHPCTTMLAHPSGRLLLQREEYELDTEAVLKACAEHGVVVEINANPYRLDLDWRWHSRALELGCHLSINPDAHSVSDLDSVRWGVRIARKGGVPPQRVLNCMDLDGLSQFFEQRRKLAR